MDDQRLLERFLQYVRIDTTAVDGASDYPSSPGQLQLGRLLVDQLHAMGIDDAEQDPHGLVYATVPATTDRRVPVVALNAHLDTSPEASGRNVRPQVIDPYRGGDLTLPGNPQQVIRIADNPELEQLVGTTIVTSDGTTLLGGDDKAGVAVIMETAAWLMEHPEVEHGPLRLLFSCDEEIGHGVDHVDLQRLGAQVAYTLDGRGRDEIDVETFSADLAVITVRGVSIHPSIAKGQMVNAVRAAGALAARLPRQRLAPEVTSEREGFLHPYHVEGGVGEVRLRVLLRDFETAKLGEQAQLLRDLASEVERDFAGVTIAVDVRRQYRNMAEGLRREPRAVRYAQLAHQRLGREAKLTIVRGGTDGAQLTERGLPTPNLSVGQHRIHSLQEWVSLEEMVQACQVLVELARIWAEQP